MTGFMASLFLVLALFAQSSLTTVVGKITGIKQGTIVLQTRSSEHQEVSMTKTTRFEKNGRRASLKDLQVGDEVTVTGSEKDGVIDAASVRFRTEMRLDHRNPKYPVKSKEQ